LYEHNGGSSTQAAGDFLINNGFTFNASTGLRTCSIGTGPVAAFPDGIVCSNGEDIIAYKLTGKVLEKIWALPGLPETKALLVAGKSIVCGARDQVGVADRASKRVVWRAKVEGTAYG